MTSVFEKGTYVLCSSHGVCRIDEITKMDLFQSGEERVYYVLSQVDHGTSRFYIPVDNQKIRMRALLSEEEAKLLIKRIPEIEKLWISNEKEREQAYKAALQTCDCEETVKIIKTLYGRKQLRLENGKKITAVDMKYLRLAEQQLYGELAVVFSMERSKVEKYLAEYMEEEKRAAEW
ncbi:MAG: CarD family transcriptional regulator [Lachnospiraceae bacterium]|nr:CarD family transcriptional regulator [Lachnospiraceae bacterium]